jgi:hypothetical protein
MTAPMAKARQGIVFRQQANGRAGRGARQSGDERSLDPSNRLDREAVLCKQRGTPLLGLQFLTAQLRMRVDELRELNGRRREALGHALDVPPELQRLITGGFGHQAP